MQKLLIASCAQKSGHEKGGLLVLDERKEDRVDSFVAALTLCDCLEVKDNLSR